MHSRQQISLTNDVYGLPSMASIQLRKSAARQQSPKTAEENIHKGSKTYNNSFTHSLHIDTTAANKHCLKGSLFVDAFAFSLALETLYSLTHLVDLETEVQDLFRLNGNVRGLTLCAAGRLVYHNARVGQCKALAWLCRHG